jgi:hypothetical protein
MADTPNNAASRTNSVSGSTLPAELDLAEAMRIMDVASALRRERETVEQEFNRDEIRARLRDKLRNTAELTGEQLTPEQLETAINWYFNNLHEYKPPKAGLETTLAHVYVRRGLIGKWLLGVGVVVLIGWWLMTSSSSPISSAGRLARRQAAAGREQAQAVAARQQREQEFEKVASVIARDADTIMTLSQDADVQQDVEGWKARVEILRREHNLEQLKEIARQVADLRDVLDDEYTVFVMAGEQSRSAFERFYEDEQGTRLSGYYVIVEARDARGQVLSKRIRNDETNSVEQVAQWAERVPAEVYERLKADKLSDGILNETRFAEKKLGQREEEVVMKGADSQPLQRSSQITKW